MNKILGIITVIIVLIICFCIILFFNRNNNVEQNLNENSTTQNNDNIEINDTIEDDEMNDVVEDEEMNEFTSSIKVIINDEEYIANLEDNETSRELVSRLPFTIEMNELNGNEKYYFFDKSFPTNSSNIGRINNGDIMLYGSDCLVLFYESFNTSYSYTRIGKIDNPNNLKNVVGNGNVTITFTK